MPHAADECMVGPIGVCEFIELPGEDFSDVHTEQHPECWVGVLQTGQAGLTAQCEKCGVGCNICIDDSQHLGLAAMNLAGQRFLRPFIPNVEGLPTQNAKNQRMDLVANEPQLVPVVVHYERASCHNQDTDNDEQRECFGSHVCSCWDTQNSTVVTTSCADGTLLDNPMSGLWPDANFIHSNKWPPTVVGQNEEGLYCRRFLDRRDALVKIVSRRHQTVFIGGGRTGNKFACANNLLVGCAATVARSSPCDDLDPGCVDVDRSAGTNYVTASSPCGSIWDEARLFDTNLALLPSASETPDGRAQRQIENAALTKVFREDFAFPGGGPLGTKFDRMLHMQTQAAGNADLGRYSRWWSGESLPLDELPAIDFNLSETRTRFGTFAPDPDGPKGPEEPRGCPVDVEVVIYKVEIDMDLYLENTKQHIPASPDRPWRYLATPYAVFDVSIWLTVRASMPTPPSVRETCRVNGEQVVLSSSDVHGPLPTVTPDGNQIRYANGEASFIRMPKKVEWHGWLANLSEPHTERREYNGGTSELLQHCKRVAVAAGEFRVGGLSTHLESDPRDPVRVYGGGVGITFQLSESFIGCSSGE